MHAPGSQPLAAAASFALGCAEHRRRSDFQPGGAAIEPAAPDVDRLLQRLGRERRRELVPTKSLDPTPVCV